MPYEMFFTLHEAVNAAMDEMSKFYNKPRNSFSADTLQPYLILVIAKTFHDLYFSKDTSEPADTYILDQRKDGFRVRLLLMEHFTAHSLGMSKQDYSFVTFKEVEQIILEADVPALD